jgi:hypothetical protein
MGSINNPKFAFTRYHNLAKLCLLITDDFKQKNIHLCCHCKKFFWKIWNDKTNVDLVANEEILGEIQQRGKDIIRFVDNLPNSFYNDGPSLMIDNFIPVIQNLREFVYVAPNCQHSSNVEFIQTEDLDSKMQCLISPIVTALSLSSNKLVEISLETLKNVVFNTIQFSCTNQNRSEEILQKLKNSTENLSNLIIFIRSKNLDIANIICNNVNKLPHFIDAQTEFLNFTSLEKQLQNDSKLKLIPTFLNAQTLLENDQMRSLFTNHQGPIIFQTNFEHSLSDYAFSLANETIVDSRK